MRHSARGCQPVPLEGLHASITWLPGLHRQRYRLRSNALALCSARCQMQRWVAGGQQEAQVNNRTPTPG